jgi:hypothetical protein
VKRAARARAAALRGGIMSSDLDAVSMQPVLIDSLLVLLLRGPAGAGEGWRRTTGWQPAGSVVCCAGRRQDWTQQHCWSTVYARSAATGAKQAPHPAILSIEPALGDLDAAGSPAAGDAAAATLGQ